MLPYKFYDCSSLVKNAIIIFDMDYIESVAALDSMDILAILILPVHEIGISLHLFVSSSFVLITVL